MSLEPLDDIIAAGLARFVSQYDNATKLKGMTEAFIAPFQEIEDATFTVLEDCWLADAVGIQLDELGAIVGQPRFGETDAAYRSSIQAKIIINRTGGEAENLFRYLRLVVDAEAIVYLEAFPAMWEIYTDAIITPEQIGRMKDLTGAGIQGVITEAGGVEPALGFLDGDVGDNLIDGFSTAITILNDVLAVTDVPDVVLDGGGFVLLTRQPYAGGNNTIDETTGGVYTHAHAV